MPIKRILTKLHQLLPASQAELTERIKELEILSNLRGKDIQEQITKEVQKMPIVYDIREDLRFQQGKAEGKSEGVETTNTAVVINLLRNTSHSMEQIAALVSVPLAFVTRIKQDMERKQI